MARSSRSEVSISKIAATASTTSAFATISSSPPSASSASISSSRPSISSPPSMSSCSLSHQALSESRRDRRFVRDISVLSFNKKFKAFSFSALDLSPASVITISCFLIFCISLIMRRFFLFVFASFRLAIKKPSEFSRSLYLRPPNDFNTLGETFKTLSDFFPSTVTDTFTCFPSFSKENSVGASDSRPIASSKSNPTRSSAGAAISSLRSDKLSCGSNASGAMSGSS